MSEAVAYVRSVFVASNKTEAFINARDELEFVDKSNYLVTGNHARPCIPLYDLPLFEDWFADQMNELFPNIDPDPDQGELDFDEPA